MEPEVQTSSIIMVSFICFWRPLFGLYGYSWLLPYNIC